jgi:hypothetical protein
VLNGGFPPGIAVPAHNYWIDNEGPGLVDYRIAAFGLILRKLAVAIGAVGLTAHLFGT